MKFLFITTLLIVFMGLMVPVTGFTLLSGNDHEPSEELQRLQKDVGQLDENLKILDNDINETYFFISNTHQKYAEEVGVSVEIIRTLHKLSLEYEVPFELAFEIARLESNFDKDLTSYNSWNNTHDRGLFQINDNTSPWLAENLGIENFNYDMTYNPELNMQMGLWYLSYLHNRYGDWHRTLTAYNRGIGGLQSYESRHGTSRSSYSRAILGRVSY